MKKPFVIFFSVLIFTSVLAACIGYKIGISKASVLESDIDSSVTILNIVSDLESETRSSESMIP